MVQILDIDKLTAEYMLRTGKEPKLLLMNTNTLKAFSQSLKPKEKIVLASDNVEEESTARISSLHLAGGITLEIAEVKTERYILAVL